MELAASRWYKIWRRGKRMAEFIGVPRPLFRVENTHVGPLSPLDRPYLCTQARENYIGVLVDDVSSRWSCPRVDRIRFGDVVSV